MTAYYIGAAVSVYDRVCAAFNFTDTYISIIVYSVLLLLCTVVWMMLSMMSANKWLFIILTTMLMKKLPYKIKYVWLKGEDEEDEDNENNRETQKESAQQHHDRILSQSYEAAHSSSKLFYYKTQLKHTIIAVKQCILALLSRIPDEYEIGHRVIATRTNQRRRNSIYSSFKFRDEKEMVKRSNRTNSKRR